jgi:hypothetical protein
MKFKFQNISPMWLFVLIICIIIVFLESRRNLYEKFAVINQEQTQSKVSGPGTPRLITFESAQTTQPELRPTYRNYRKDADEEILGDPVPPSYDSTAYPQNDNDAMLALSGQYRINPLRTRPNDEYRLNPASHYRGSPSIWTPELLGSSPLDYALTEEIQRPWPLMNVPSKVGTEPRYDIQEVYNPAVVGCGGRREACDGGSQEVIPNWKPPRSVSSENIAPRGAEFPSWNEKPSQVGVLARITGPGNNTLPLYMKRIDQITFFYYTVTGPESEQLLRVETTRVGEKLGMNDEVMIHGLPGTFRVVEYQDDTGMYVPGGF